ncbi:MAG TPA: TrkH family potassium uptake protein [Candidatus Pelagibacter sp.]|jgi:trk system potassium uptake protein TrkH|nr:TrkH family potassium uptake protein [Candidatus Pelagibacter sp.]
MNNNKTIFFAIGLLLIILGTFMLIPFFVQFIYDEKNNVFLSSASITVFIGILLVLANLEENRKLNLQQAFLLTTLSWLGIALFGSLPFLLSNLNLSFVDSFFESMSGITTTGSTIITNLDAAPKSILIWRAILQWLGGIGVIVMAITILPLLNVGGMQLFRMESSDTTEKILPKTREVTLTISIIYISLTFVCGVAYQMAGMNIFDSIAHSMTTIATGGFSTYSKSIGHFQNARIEVISIIFIILGSIPFIAYIKFVKGEKKIFFKDIQIRGLIYILIFSIFLMFIYLLISNKEYSFLENLRISSFNVVSVLSGTGYVTDDFSSWGKFPLIFFLLLMFIGGCAGSTTCGIKIFRFQILGRFILNQLKKLIYPHGIFSLKYNNEKISNTFVYSIMTFIFLYFFIFFILATLLSLNGLDFITAISGSASAISNVGPGLGSIIGPDGNFSDLPTFSKLSLSFGMLLGRLELFAVLVLFFPSFWKN